MLLDRSFYISEDILQLSKSLLGKRLCTDFDGFFCSGIIVETEAYKAPEDKASHAFGNKRTPRTENMFSKGGTSYVYICYGIHSLFNIITAPEGIPHCILIRAIEPDRGFEKMSQRRNLPYSRVELTNGPGKLAQALGIQKIHNGLDLTANKGIWIEDVENTIQASDISSGPRVGMSTAQESSNWPWRFRIIGNKWTSKPDKVWYEKW